MDIHDIRQMLKSSPTGIRITLIDGESFDIPSRDHAWFTPGVGQSPDKVDRFATAFYIADDGVGRLIDAPRVANAVPLRRCDNARDSHSDEDHDD